jgi:hypothetical protein
VEGSCEHGNAPSYLHKLFRNNRVAAQLAASQEGVSYLSAPSKLAQVVSLLTGVWEVACSDLEQDTGCPD